LRRLVVGEVNIDHDVEESILQHEHVEAVCRKRAHLLCRSMLCDALVNWHQHARQYTAGTYNVDRAKKHESALLTYVVYVVCREQVVLRRGQQHRRYAENRVDVSSARAAVTL
jgi:hypothetical protein